MRDPIRRLTAYCEAEQELLGFAEGADDALAEAIGANVARFVPDGATIQTGLGRISTAALRALRGRRGLRIHSGLIPEAVVDLADAGALAPGVSIVGGVAIGARRLYDRVGESGVPFRAGLSHPFPEVIGRSRRPSRSTRRSRSISTARPIPNSGPGA